MRNHLGRCVRCAPNESGEAIGRIADDSSSPGNRFEGYSEVEPSEKKILRDVFETGDAWFRTGDLLRQDERGYLYFVDRIGDTFRWKGENVSTPEVEQAICAFPGIEQASVFGVSVPGAEGRAGMAILVTRQTLDLGSFREHLASRLPDYSQPLFIRLRGELEVTGTFKHAKTQAQREGYDPAQTADALYFNQRRSGAFVPLDEELYARIQSGMERL